VLGLAGSQLQLDCAGAGQAAEVSRTTVPITAAESAMSFIADENPDPAAGSVHVLPLPGQVPSQLLLAGLGDGSAADLRVTAVALGRAIRELDENRTVAVAIAAPDEERSRSLAEGLVLGGYDFLRRSDADEALHTVDLVGTVTVEAIGAGDDAADAAGWARDLGNMPAAELTPTRFGELAEQQLAPAGCTVTVRDTAWLSEHGFGGILAVGAGSVSPPTLIEASYRPSRHARAAGDGPVRHVVLVGKGITFDTGGLNLKPAEPMRMMHTDMCGGAAVLGAVQYAAMRKLPVRVTALVAAAENSVSGTAMRPSDVITHFGGRTTEIGNTDAEGRLVLADALAYAVARLRPDVVIDIATLTGAMKVALGLEIAGYFCNDDEVAADLDAASTASGEEVWRMPLEHRYTHLLDSPVADARNDPGNPGGITAALFLQPFVGSTPWVHLDIAGPARAMSDGPVFSRGATGFGARLLGRYLERLGVGGAQQS
jgi:leucyl aminopeptidase